MGTDCNQRLGCLGETRKLFLSISHLRFFLNVWYCLISPWKLTFFLLFSPYYRSWLQQFWNFYFFYWKISILQLIYLSYNSALPGKDSNVPGMDQMPILKLSSLIEVLVSDFSKRTDVIIVCTKAPCHTQEWLQSFASLRRSTSFRKLCEWHKKPGRWPCQWLDFWSSLQIIKIYKLPFSSSARVLILQKYFLK